MERRDDFFIPEELAEWIGLKKSEYLSELIVHLDATDIGFERFHDFDHLIPQTIETPDRIFERTEDKERVRCYVRTYEDGVHQVIIGVLVEDKTLGDQVFVPILNFVSTRSELVQKFCHGSELTRPSLS